MRSENEKTGRPVSIRLPNELRTKLEEEAERSGLKFSSYIVYCLRHSDNSLTPEIMIGIQNIVNKAVSISEGSPEKSEEIRKEVDKLWQLLR